MAKKIAGIALMARQSLNGVYYHLDELQKFHDIQVPLRFNHNQDPEGIIGDVKFEFHPETQQVRYTANITDEKIQQLVDEEQFQVSIGATVAEPSELCDNTGRDCINAPVIGSIDELSIVKVPGIPESTLNVLEATPTWTGTGTTAGNIKLPTFTFTQPPKPNHDRMKCGGIKKDCESSIYTSIKVNPKKVKSMADKTSKPEKVEEKVKVTIETDDKIEVKDGDSEKKEEAPAKEVAKETPTEEVKEEKPKVDESELTKKVTENATKEVKNILEEVRSNWTPKSEVKESVDVKSFQEDEFSDEEARKILEKLDDNGYVKIKIDKEDWIQSRTRGYSKEGGQLTEAVATSGTIPTVVADNQVVVDKSGKTEVSLRQWGKFKAIPTGANTARFYRVTVPDAGAITESPTTDITASTHTLTSIDVTCSPRGWRQTVERSEFEDFPAAFLNAVRETARVEAVRDEHRLIVTTLASTDNDFGGTTTEPYHISADDGLAITTTTLEDAAGQLAPDGLSLAKQHLQTIHDPSLGPNALVAFLAPIAFESLYTNTNLSEYTMIGSPSVTRTGILEKVYGIDIVITNELEVQNNAFRNLVCVKGKAWALASQRSMSIQLQDQIAGQYTDVVWTHRIGVDELDHSAYVIISGPNA